MSNKGETMDEHMITFSVDRCWITVSIPVKDYPIDVSVDRLIAVAKDRAADSGVSIPDDAVVEVE